MQPHAMALVVFLHFLVLLLYSFCLLREVKSTSLKGSIDAGDGILLYSNFFAFPNRKLHLTPVDSPAVESEDECIEACNENSKCQSLNFKPAPNADGKFTCHLLDADKFTSSERLFNVSTDFRHYSFTVSQVPSSRREGKTIYLTNKRYILLISL